MKKEIFKNIALVFLITLSFVLFFNIWFSEKLWSYDYNFFAIERNFSGGEAQTALAVEDIIAPGQIIITGGGKRSVMRKSEGEYDDCYSRIEAVALSLPHQQKYVRADESEWISNLKSKSILLDFGVSLSEELLQRLNLRVTGISAQDIMVTGGDGIISKPCVYIKDVKTAEIYKIVAENSNEDIDAMITKYNSKASAQNIPFAFELGFDGSRDPDMKIKLEPNIAIGLSGFTSPKIEAGVPEKMANIAQGSDVPDNLIKVFGINRSSMRRYIEKNDVFVYVDKNATLKISPQGFVEYIAEGDGVPIVSEGGEKNSAAYAVSGMYSLVRNIAKACNADEMQMQISSDFGDAENYEILIDYYVNGNPIMVMENGKAEHAIKIKIENGNLKELKQYVYKVNTSQEELQLPSTLSAINSIYSLGISGDIREIFTAYIQNSGETLYRWCAKISGVDDIIIIENTEGGI